MKTLLPEIDSPDKRFHAGNPATGEQGTRVTDTWLNDVQDRVRDVQAEAHYVLQKAGFIPVENKQTQLYDAIVKIIDDNRKKASTTQKGEVKLYSGYDSDSEEMAATPKAIKLLKAFIDALTRNLTNYIPNSKKSSDVNSASADNVATSAAVKKAYDKAESKWTAQPATETTAGILPISHKSDGTDKNKFASEFAVGEAAKKGLPVGAIVAFPSAVTNPNGFLRANGSTFNASAFPDLFKVLGNSNQLPDLTRSDVGMTAYFATDAIPAGWIAFDDIAAKVSAQTYPELYRHLVAKYGSIASVPKVDDRFLRNAGNGLSVGQTQEDAIRNITGKFGPVDGDDRHTGAFRQEESFGYGATLERSRWWVSFDASRVVPVANENRPKSLILKLCIKAINSFDDVVFWIKSHGEVTNAGTLDAGRLAQGLQDKADRNHTHTASQITDFNQATSQIINAVITYQKIGNFEIRKYPDGTMIQSYLIEQYDLNGWQEKSFNWAQAFISTPMIFSKITTSISGQHDCDVNILTKSNNRTCYYHEYEHGTSNQGNVRIEFLAMGRWKQ